MSRENQEKLRVKPWRIIKIFILTFIVFEAIFYLSFQGVNGVFFPFDKSFYFYTPALIIASFIFCYISLTQTYYQIDGPLLVHSKMGKVIDYNFSNIVYIDKEFSEQKKLMRFFTRDGSEHLLMFDKNAIIYKTALVKCPLLTEEEFLRRYPNVKMWKYIVYIN